MWPTRLREKDVSFPVIHLDTVERPMIAAMDVWHSPSHVFDESPGLRPNARVHPFGEEDPQDLAKILRADRVLGGSAHPDPEGVADLITFVGDLVGLPEQGIEKIMGGNVKRLMGLPGRLSDRRALATA